MNSPTKPMYLVRMRVAAAVALWLSSAACGQDGPSNDDPAPGSPAGAPAPMVAPQVEQPARVQPMQPMTPVTQPAPQPTAEPSASPAVDEASSGQDTPQMQEAAEASAARTDRSSVLEEELFPVSEINIIVDPVHPGLPTPEQLSEVFVSLERDGDLLLPPEEGAVVPGIAIKDIGSDGTVLLTRASIQEVLNRLSRFLTEERQLLGAVALPNIQDILIAPPEGFQGPTDFRGDRTDLTIIVLNGVVKQVRTVASGGRFDVDTRLNNPAHVRILDRSPIGVVEDGVYTDDNRERDLLRGDLLDEYVLRLNRFPGRRVDVALAPGEAAGEATLDYLISENKQWLLYSQLSNTGTESTEDWRQRFGAQFTQLANLDDILSLEYITAGFSSSHAAIASYESAIPNTDRWRGRVYGDFSDFTASDVGLADERFTGESFTVGGDLIWNFFQDRELFVDAFAGIRWNQTEVFNEVVGVQGREHFLIPKFGLRAEANTEKWSFDAETSFEWSLAELSGGKNPGLERLGRLAPDEDWSVFRYAVNGSFYLEPLLFGSKWRDTSTWRTSTLAHEIALSVRGQYAMDNRLIPNQQQVVGGLYSVRGYPESVVAGDNVVIASAEYRWHVPRSFRPLSVPNADGTIREPGSLFGQPFNYAPRSVYGRPDWDLVLKAFMDVGRSENVDRQAFEQDEDLWGAGVGADLLFYRNISVRVDWAVALDDVENQNVKSGSNRFHLVFTLLF